MTMRGKTLLFVGGGRETVPALNYATELGIRVVVIDGDPNCDAARLGFKLLVASTYDALSALAAAKVYVSMGPVIDGVTSVGTDCAYTVAVIAESLGLPGIPTHAALIGSNKVLLKELLNRAKVPNPKSAPVFEKGQIKDVLGLIGLPCVVKPADSRGSRGVLLVRSEAQAEASVEESVRFSPTRTVLVESFRAGKQFSTESFFIDGSIYTVGISSRNYELLAQTEPNFLENGGSLPVPEEASIREWIDKFIPKFLEEIGAKSGTIKLDLVAVGNAFEVIELALRPSGGYFCSHEIPLNSGVDFLQNLFRLCLRLPIDLASLEPKRNIQVTQRYIFSSAPEINKIRFPPWAGRDPQIKFWKDFTEVKASPLRDASGSLTKVGVVIGIGDPQRVLDFVAETQIE